jgi:hypothetical protein
MIWDVGNALVIGMYSGTEIIDAAELDHIRQSCTCMVLSRTSQFLN